jgi:pimeloyl-ACP methyl ester carboxylesterase
LILLAHGDTEIGPNQDVSVTVDIVGNDSGGGICQIFCALYPERVRSLTLTNCDTHDNWPPVAFQPFVAMVKAGGLRKMLDAMLSNKAIYRSPDALGPAYEHPEKLSDDTIEKYLRPLVATEQRTSDLERFVNAFDNKHTVAIRPKLKTLKAPTLIIRGTDDVYFDVKWSHWLSETIPGTKRRVEFEGARIFFPKNAPRTSTRNCATSGSKQCNDAPLDSSLGSSLQYLTPGHSVFRFTPRSPNE